MRTSMLLIAMLAAGCSQQPSRPGAAAAAPVADAADGAESPRDVQLKRVATARRLHLKVVDQDGNELFCKTFMVTGSRIQTETRCLTAEQLDHYDEQSQRDVDRVFKLQSPASPPGLQAPSR